MNRCTIKIDCAFGMIRAECGGLPYNAFASAFLWRWPAHQRRGGHMKKLRSLWGRFSALRGHIRAARTYKSVPVQLIDLFLHKLIINTHPRHYYRYKFYRGDKTRREKERYVGQHDSASMYWPYENIELKYDVILTDKYIQKIVLRGLNLPTAALLATVGKSFAIATEAQMNSFLASIETACAIKPMSGTGGSKLLVLERSGDDFTAAGRRYTAAAIWAHVRDDLETGFLVEERLANIPATAALYPNSLNTFRVIMIKTHDNVWHVAGSYFKLGTGGAQADNSDSGGLLVLTDELGKTTGAWKASTGERLSRHPDTDVPLVGVQLDGYQEVIDLAARGSHALGFIGTMGWDIAYTEHGARIVEVNGSWDSYYIQNALGRGLITDELARGLKKRYFFTPWDRRKYFPGAHSKKR